MNYGECVYKKDETKNGSQIVLSVFRTAGGYVFSLNVHLIHLIRSFYPSPDEKPYKTEREAKSAAVAKIRQWIGKSRKMNELFYQFGLSYCDQPTLFDGI